MESGIHVTVCDSLVVQAGLQGQAPLACPSVPGGEWKVEEEIICIDRWSDRQTNKLTGLK